MNTIKDLPRSMREFEFEPASPIRVDVITKSGKVYVNISSKTKVKLAETKRLREKWLIKLKIDISY